jgi:hypothetical protein
MKFIVNVAADVYGRKENLRFFFESRPTLAKLTNTTESEFDIACRGSRPVGYPDLAFRVQNFQIYDDILLRWVDLYSEAQLTSGCQVYAFQPESMWNPYYRGLIPAAKDTVTWESTASSPRRLSLERGIAPSTLEKVRTVFAELDSASKGYVLYSDLRAALERNGIAFTYETVGSLFNKADMDHDGSINYGEWTSFALDNMNLVDAVFFRELDASSQPKSRSNNRGGASIDEQREREYRLAQERRRESDMEFEKIRRELDAAKLKFDIAAEEERILRSRMF